jgi:hypothetical protein
MAVPKKKNKKVKFKYSKLKLFIKQRYKKTPSFCKFCLKGITSKDLLFKKNLNNNILESNNSLIFRRVNTKSKVCDNCQYHLQVERKSDEEKEKNNKKKEFDNIKSYIHF